MAACDLPQLCLIITNKEGDVVFGRVFNMGELFTSATENDVLRWDAKALHQVQLMLRDKHRSQNR